jgi:hypothetical protein
MTPMNDDKKWPGLNLAVVGVTFLLVLAGFATGVSGLKQVPFTDTGNTFPVVQVLPNFSFTPDCNMNYCAVLFTEGKADLYAPRTYTLGPGKPAYYDLTLLEPYRISDGSILYAPRGSGPTAYTTSKGQIRIQFSFLPGEQYGGGPRARRGH